MSAPQVALERALRAVRIVPVLTIETLDQAVPLARALVDGGLPVLEVTLRTPAAAEAARAIMAELPQAIVGLGTLLAPSDVDLAVELGVRFIVSPGATPALLAAARQSALPFLPGIATASEAMPSHTADHRMCENETMVCAEASANEPGSTCSSGPEEVSLKPGLQVPRIPIVSQVPVCSSVRSALRTSTST